MKSYWDLLLSFAKIGLFTIGGGYAMLPAMQSEIVDRRRWATGGEMLDYYALSQCTPGAIAVNVATFVGYRQKGVPGAFLATLGLVFPSLVIIMAISAFLGRFAGSEIAEHAFSGIRVGVSVLIVNAVTRLTRSALADRKGIPLFVIVFLGALLTPLSPALFVLFSGLLGILIRVLEAGRR